MWNTVIFWVTQNMTTNRGKSILRLPLAFQEMYQCEVIIEMIASYLVGEKLVRQEGRFPCGAIIFIEQKKKNLISWHCICIWTSAEKDTQKLSDLLSKLQEFLALLQREQDQPLNFAHIVQVLFVSLLFFKYLASVCLKVLVFQHMTAKRLPLALTVYVNRLFFIIQVIWT